jgi:hypothetical protein
MITTTIIFSFKVTSVTFLALRAKKKANVGDCAMGIAKQVGS